MRASMGMTSGVLFAALLATTLGTAHAQRVYDQRGYDRDTYERRTSDRTTRWSTTSRFVNMAAQGGMVEVMMGRLASRRAMNADVRDFAVDMIDDHRNANLELQRIATRRGISVPDDIDSQHQAMVNQLRAVRRGMFDREYMRTMVHDHDMTVALFERYADRGTDRELRAWAQRTLPTLRHHQEMAHALAEDVGVRVAGYSRYGSRY